MIQIYFFHVAGNIHPVYQEMLQNPPDGIDFINSGDFGVSYEKNISTTLKNTFFQRVLTYFKKKYIFPNISLQKHNADIIYSCQTLQIYGNYILDLDCYEALNRFSNKKSLNKINKIIVRYFLRKENCKKIIFWSENAKLGFQGYHGNEFDSKTEVLHPSISIKHTFETLRSWKNTTQINILFVGRYFERKGGILAIEAFEKLQLISPNLQFHIISDVPEKIKVLYQGNKGITFHGLLKREKVREYFKKADIFLMPTLHEIFGFVFLEAFAYGAIPISLDTFAVNNIISDSEDGYIINYHKKFHTDNFHFIDKYNENIDILIDEISHTEEPKILDIIILKLSNLIDDNTLRLSFQESGFEKIKNGSFSLLQRNDKLENIFKSI